MKLHKILGLTIISTIVFYSCNTQKNTFLNRNVNTLKTEFNVLYNGQVAFEKGLETLSEKHEDNFWKRLEIEPITFDERQIIGPKFNSPGAGFDDKDSKTEKKALSPFDIAEEKSVKAIQKYAMNIDGYEKNRQTDDAYLLLGKSRYYTQRFIPAIESYNYIIANYPKADLNYETRVWRAKANVRLGNEETAIETMNLLLKVLDEKEEVSKRVKEEAYTAMAIAYSETDSVQKLIENLTNATETFINKEQSARNMFVLGQIYSDLNRKDSARMVFQKLADKRRAPDKYRIHANIELVKNAEGDSSTVALIKRFKKLIKKSDNRKYSDELYYHVGVLEENRDSIDQAIQYYQRSIKANGNNYQKTYTYERLGNISFNKQNYLIASAYYDSVLQLSTEKFDEEKRIRRIRRKNKGLITLRKHESTVKNNDSILQLVAMTADERTIYFEKYIEKIKKEDEERKQQLLNAQSFGSQLGNNITANNNAGKWYFYSSQSKSFGKSEFQKTWGNRSLEDNWRWSDKTTISTQEEDEEEVGDSVLKKYELATYLDAIPSEEEAITKLKEDRNDALYQLGLIYKEQFKNNELAIKNFESLKVSNTNNDLILPINYHLYQLYTRSGDTVKSEDAKNYILENHSDSKFASIIKYPNKKIEVKDEEQEKIAAYYKNLYLFYKSGKYGEVLKGIGYLKEAIAENSELIPKLALLKALTIGKHKSKEEYRKELEFVAFSYANKEEGKKAQEIIKLFK